MNIEPQSFEEGMTELESLVKTLEDGRMPLEKAIAAFDRGNYLRKFCEDKLKQAKLKIEEITVDADNQVSTSAISNL